MKKVLLVLLVVVAGFAAFVATRAAKFHIERSIAIRAPDSVVYPLIASFHAWPTWSPWEKLDPSMTKAFSGPESGAGANYVWKGNNKVGEGSMTITSAKPPEQVVVRIDFLAPMKATNTATFDLKQHAGTTLVKWNMDGNNDFFGKAFSVFVDMDKMVGDDFEKGLAAMKAQAEANDKKIRAEAPPKQPPAEPAPAATP